MSIFSLGQRIRTLPHDPEHEIGVNLISLMKKKLMLPAPLVSEMEEPELPKFGRFSL